MKIPSPCWDCLLFLQRNVVQVGETVSRPGTGVGGGLSRPGTGKIWTVEGDEALEGQGEDIKSMSPTGLYSAHTDTESVLVMS